MIRIRRGVHAAKRQTESQQFEPGERICRPEGEKPMTSKLDTLRKRAENLRRLASSGDLQALERVGCFYPSKLKIRQSEALHVIANEHGFKRWTKLRFAHEADEMDRMSKAERLKMALFFGQHWVVDRLIASDPTIAHENLGLELALYDWSSVKARLAADPGAATRKIGVRNPILHLCFSRHIQADPRKTADMLAIAEELVELGADVNDSFPYAPEASHTLSALYGALGHAGNVTLAEWLLNKGANPNDDESLYHSTELGCADGVRLLLNHGARIDGTNALMRAIDFNNHTMVELMLNNGASPNCIAASHPSGEPSLGITALHQAARRMCDSKMAQLLMAAGADPDDDRFGHSAYATARIYGNHEVAQVIADAGGQVELDQLEATLADAADGAIRQDSRICIEDLPSETRYLLVDIIKFPDRLDHAKRLASLGFDFETQDKMGLTPLHVAGWEGIPEAMEWLLPLGPNLEHVNGYGGTLLSTIVHGSENCPARNDRMHICCARLALEAGVPLPIPCIELAGDENMAEFLVNWAEDHPEQVTEEGIG